MHGHSGSAIDMIDDECVMLNGYTFTGHFVTHKFPEIPGALELMAAAYKA
jgi:hypothetical protein